MATATSVAPLNRVAGLGAADGLGLAENRDHRHAGAGAEGTLRERPADCRTVARYRHPLDAQLAECHLQLLDDLRPLVGAADHRAQLACLVVVELDHRRRRVVGGAAIVVDLALPVVVEDHGDPASLREREGVLHADAGQTGFLKIDGHQLARAV